VNNGETRQHVEKNDAYGTLTTLHHPADVCQLLSDISERLENERQKRTCRTPPFNLSAMHHSAAALFDFAARVKFLAEYLFLIMFYNYGERVFLNQHLPDFIPEGASPRDIETEIHTKLSLPVVPELDHRRPE